jgi:signal transduction histidine kinase
MRSRTTRLSESVRRLGPRRVRARLTLLFGALFTISGAALLGITYLLVARATDRVAFVRIGDSGPPRSMDLGQAAPSLDANAQAWRNLAWQQHQEDLHHLLIQSGVALAIMLVISIGLGWLVAGRILRPLRAMTITVQQISEHNLHERLAVGGPRDELKDLADTIDGLLSRLDSALGTHKRFVANAAHELRTPLTVEHALLEETLIDRDANLQSFRDTFQRLLALNQQRARLLESLLTLTGSEQGLGRRELVDLSALTRTLLHATRAQADGKELRLKTVPRPAALSGDPALVERLVANLIDNAIEHNVPRGHVNVTTGTRAGQAVLTVTNTGRQIPPDEVDRLFEPFQRLDRTAHRRNHHGLGLSIVRAIAAAHDAHLTAQARPGGGLTIEVSFPPPAGEPTTTQPRPAKTARLAVLPRPDPQRPNTPRLRAMTPPKP